MKTRDIMLLTLAAETAVIVTGCVLEGWNIQGLQLTTRYSGRLSLVLFSIIFLLHPDQKESLGQLLSGQYFLAFALAHGIHLIELLTFVSLSGTVLVPYRLAGGFLAYLLIFLMPWVNSRHQRGSISDVRYRSLGYVYLFYVWFIFFMTYVGRLKGAFSAPNDSHLVHYAWMSWLVLLLFYKISKMWTLRQRA